MKARTEKEMKDRINLTQAADIPSAKNFLDAKM